MSDERITVLIDKTGLSVWSDGKFYDPGSECYRPVYSYSIKTPDWEYLGNDIHGAANEPVSIERGMQSLLAFLYACQEGYLNDPNHERDNAKIFPPHVREWAYQFNDELSTAAIEHNLATSFVRPAVSDPGATVDAADDEAQLHHCPQCGEPCGVTDYSDGRCKTCVRADEQTIANGLADGLDFDDEELSLGDFDDGDDRH